MAKKEIKRKHLRFQPEPLNTALVQFKSKASTFDPDMVALIVSESFGGCGLLALCSKKIKAGDKVKVKVGPVQPLSGEVVWVKDLEESIVRFGVRFLE